MYVFVSKDTRLNIRIRPTFKADLEGIADYYGLTVSSYVHSVLVREVRREKENIPEAFLISEQTANGKKLAPKSKEKMPLKTSKDAKKKVA